jgi:hypothetical protein
VGKEEAHQQKICKGFALRSQLQTTFVNSYKRGEGGGSGRVDGGRGGGGEGGEMKLK